MGLFEERPLLLVPLILTVVVVYDALKLLARRIMQMNGNRRRTHEP